MDKLPTELLYIIFKDFSKNERIRLRLVNKQLCEAFSRDLWEELYLSYYHSRQRGKTNVESIQQFNKSLEMYPNRVELIKTVHIEASTQIDDINFTIMNNLTTVYIDQVLFENDLIPLDIPKLLLDTAHAKYHHVYLASAVSPVLENSQLTSLTIIHNDLSISVNKLFNTPYLPNMQSFTFISNKPLYADLLEKCLSRTNLKSLSLIVKDIYNPYKVEWIPENIEKLQVSRERDGNYMDDYGVIDDEYLAFTNAISITVFNPQICLPGINAPNVQILTLILPSNMGEIDDPIGEFYSIDERFVGEQAARFSKTVRTLKVKNISLGLTAWLCQNLPSVTKLHVYSPKSAATTTFIDFNGMMTRLAHHNINWLIDKMGNIEELHIDDFFEFSTNSEENREFLGNIMKINKLQKFSLGLDIYHEIDMDDTLFGDCIYNKWIETVYKMVGTIEGYKMIYEIDVLRLKDLLLGLQ